jgi:hypothetical protein
MIPFNLSQEGEVARLEPVHRIRHIRRKERNTLL